MADTSLELAVSKTRKKKPAILTTIQESADSIANTPQQTKHELPKDEFKGSTEKSKKKNVNPKGQLLEYAERFIQDKSNQQDQGENSKIDHKSRKKQSVGMFMEEKIDFEKKSISDMKDKILPKKVKKVAINIEDNIDSIGKTVKSKDNNGNIKDKILKHSKESSKVNSRKRFQEDILIASQVNFELLEMQKAQLGDEHDYGEDEELMRVKKEEEQKDNEDVKEYEIQWNWLQFFCDKRIQLKAKLVFLLSAGLVFSDAGACIANFVQFITSDCFGYEAEVELVDYFNIIMSMILKTCCLNILSQEVTNTLPGNIQLPFLVPMVIMGITPCLQLNQYVYSFSSCNMLNPIISYKTARKLTRIISYSLIGIAALSCLVITLLQVHINRRSWKIIKNIGIYILLGLFLLGLVFLFIFLSVLQLHKEVIVALILDNISFWFFFLLALIFSVQKFICKIEPFSFTPQQLSKLQSQNKEGIEQIEIKNQPNEELKQQEPVISQKDNQEPHEKHFEINAKKHKKNRKQNTDGQDSHFVNSKQENLKIPDEHLTISKLDLSREIRIIPSTKSQANYQEQQNQSAQLNALKSKRKKKFQFTSDLSQQKDTTSLNSNHSPRDNIQQPEFKNYLPSDQNSDSHSLQISTLEEGSTPPTLEINSSKRKAKFSSQNKTNQLQSSGENSLFSQLQKSNQNTPDSLSSPSELLGNSNPHSHRKQRVKNVIPQEEVIQFTANQSINNKEDRYSQRSYKSGGHNNSHSETSSVVSNIHQIGDYFNKPDQELFSLNKPFSQVNLNTRARAFSQFSGGDLNKGRAKSQFSSNGEICISKRSDDLIQVQDAKSSNASSKQNSTRELPYEINL